MALWLNEGWWVKTADGRTGWIDEIAYDRALIIFADNQQAKKLPVKDFVIHEKISPEVKQEVKKVFIDMALDTGDFNWLRELEENNDCR